ncbi:unnamed protein product [Gongylonema pulchrum]|uniref:Adenosylmethionine decarboxylase n=1 Tax=Gongylonema pulchrum TaxID=637853 RepID=A0A183DKN8_9BILA|nr:unnamed protein product [Gongylonema pulchrum]
MFISDYRIILKTCGTTRLLHTIGRLLHLAKLYSNLSSVVSVFYSRKNFMRPEKQPYPHSSFDSEIDFLESYFTGGFAYCLGPVNQDRWFLYTMVAPQAALPYPDHTLEILMTEIPDEVVALFSRNVCLDGADCRMVVLIH